MRIIILTIYILCIYESSAQTSEKILTINTGGHKSTIWDMVVDKEGKVITVSDDKTIKIWNSKEGYLEREIYGQIGRGKEGLICSVALSPDNKYLAVGGWFGSNNRTKLGGYVRLYNYRTGKLIRLLACGGYVLDLAFFPSSKHLLTQDGGGQVLLWDVENNKSQQLENIASDINDLEIGENFYVTTHESGLVHLWSFEKHEKPLATFKKLQNESLPAQHIAISPNGERIAVSCENNVYVLDNNLKQIYEIYAFSPGEDPNRGLCFSPNSQRLLVASSSRSTETQVMKIYDERDGYWFEGLSFTMHKATVKCVAFINNTTCVTAGGSNNEVAIWTADENKNSSTLKYWLAGVGSTNWSVGMDGDKIAFSTTKTKHGGFSAYQFVFDLTNRAIRNYELTDSCRYPLHVYNEYSGATSNVGAFLKLKKGTSVIGTVKRDGSNGSYHKVFTFVSDEYFVSGGLFGWLEALDKTGKKTNVLIGHEADLTGLGVSSDGKFLISSAADQTIRLWKISEFGTLKKGNLPSVWDYCKENKIDDKYYPFLTSLNLQEKAKLKTNEAWQEIINALNENDFNCQTLEMKFDEEVLSIYPVVSIFIAKNNEWVIWNEDGYFTSSKKGASYVGYHLNQGEEKEAKYYSFEQFDTKYNRPDIIMESIGLVDQSIIDLYHSAYLKRLKRMGLEETDLSGVMNVPVVQIQYTTLSKEKVSITVSASDSLYDIRTLNVFLNDVPIYGRNGLQLGEMNLKTIEKTVELDLMAGVNNIQISVTNSAGVESLKEKITLNNSIETESNLYIVSLGVSNYKDSTYNLDYAAKDAEDVSVLFSESVFYQNVHQKTLVNQEVTRANIAALKDFLSQANRNDVVVFFIAGHGVLNKDLDYYFCTYDMDFLAPEKHGITYSELETLFDGIKAIRKLLIMDTCHSGEVDKDDVEEIAFVNTENSDIAFRNTNTTTTIRETQGLEKTNEAVKEMFNDLRRGTGATVISSAGGAEYAMESDEWKNGLFTYCLLEGIKTKNADADKNGEIMLSELQNYISIKVAELSKGRQMPTSRFENLNLDYRIW